MNNNIDNREAVYYDGERDSMVILDQTLLPNEVKWLTLTSAEEVWEAIKVLRVRGAPVIGVAAAIGAYVSAKQIKAERFEDFSAEFGKVCAYLNSSRPTAVNLSWALNSLQLPVNNLQLTGNDWREYALKAILAAALEIYRGAIADSEKIGEYGLSLTKPGDGILTHCNAGRLACMGIGTATAPIYAGHKRGYGFKVYADETRPLLQGARLTAYELYSAGVDVTLLCDNMAASLMKSGKINAVFVGADRVAANGDTANKIGTLGVAVLAKLFGVPFYVCAPYSTIDAKTKTGADIVIEQREPSEVSEMWYKKPMTADGVKIYNPAFDVTDAELITAFVTEKGIVKPPYKFS
ncbi:MAG: S-methyl-5-thioribose-1-phosphate isomerase [Oscillospiraceae bacterium]|jgi:methylthioribose-1-phosphate isomerase|nr:S-methyl-5-thioribose-1-phosphate isomerase [Oscillospiraceae bacterium]